MTKFWIFLFSHLAALAIGAVNGGGATFTTSSTDVVVYTVNSEDTGYTNFQMIVDIDP